MWKPAEGLVFQGLSAGFCCARFVCDKAKEDFLFDHVVGRGLFNLAVQMGALNFYSMLPLGLLALQMSWVMVPMGQ